MRQRKYQFVTAPVSKRPSQVCYLLQVAITVFWLGKYAQHHFEGPQLDFSAFADLVNHHQYKSVLQLSPTSSASRSSDSESTISDRQGSPRSTAKRGLSLLQPVQEDQCDPEVREIDPTKNHCDALREEESTRNTDLVRDEQDHTSDDRILKEKPPGPVVTQDDNLRVQPTSSSSIAIHRSSQSLPFSQQEFVHEHKRHPSLDSVGYSSAYGSCYSGESKAPSQTESAQHLRDNSYDSALSEDRSLTSLIPEDKVHTWEDSKGSLKPEDHSDLHVLEKHEDEKDVKMSTGDSRQASNIRYSATFDAVYDQDNRCDDTGRSSSDFLEAKWVIFWCTSVWNLVCYDTTGCSSCPLVSV